MREITVSGEPPHCEENRPFLEWQLSFPFWCSEIAVSALSFSEKRGFMQSLGNSSFRLSRPDLGLRPRFVSRIRYRPQRYPPPP